MIEDAVFSHTDLFAKPTLNQKQASAVASADITRIYKINAIMGHPNKIYVLGLLTQKEDTYYYLEDATYSIRVTFSDLQYADPEFFFTENQVLLCNGYYRGEMFHAVSVEQPPMYAARSREINFKVNQSDYFGAYSKLHKELVAQ